MIHKNIITYRPAFCKLFGNGFEVAIFVAGSFFALLKKLFSRRTLLKFRVPFRKKRLFGKNRQSRLSLRFYGRRFQTRAGTPRKGLWPSFFAPPRETGIFFRLRLFGNGIEFAFATEAFERAEVSFAQRERVALFFFVREGVVIFSVGESADGVAHFALVDQQFLHL